MKSRIVCAYVIAAMMLLTSCGQAIDVYSGTNSKTAENSAIVQTTVDTSSLKAKTQTDLPDIQNGEKGKGFTCTGLAYDEKEDVFWIGNCGKMQPNNAKFQPTIVKVKKDFSQVIEELPIYSVYPSMATESVGSIQGVCVDTSDDTIWFASQEDGAVRHIKKNGDTISEFACEQVSGIAYSSKDDTLWMLTRTALMNVSKTGDTISRIDVSVEGQDQLFLDGDSMYFTAGNNYKSENYVYRVDLVRGAYELAYTLADSHCVEGIFLSGNEMVVLNDGYYHNGKIRKNIACTYEVTRDK